MFCRKCGKEIKNTMAFCPFCGTVVKTKVSSNSRNVSKDCLRLVSSFSFKKIILILILITGIAALGLFLLRQVVSSETDWERIIRTDLLSGTTEIEKTIFDVVDIAVKEDDAQLLVTVTAPDICDELLDWVESVPEEDFTEEQLEEEILRLLKSVEVDRSTNVLSYMDNDGTVAITYTQKIGEIVSCGLARFYAELTQRVMGELGGEG